MSDDPLDLDTGLPARVAADAAALAPLALGVARRLPVSADTHGVMRPGHGALARALGADVAGIVSALDQLARRGHLVAAPGRDQRRPVGYRFATEPSSAGKKPQARIVPFPRRHDRGFLERIAGRMARLSRRAAAVYLRRALHDHAEELRRHGIAEELIEREIDTLGSAIKAASFVAVLTPDDQEPA